MKASAKPVVLGVALAAFTIIGVLPVVLMMSESILMPNGTRFDAGFQLDSRTRLLLINSVCLALGTSLIAMAIGVPAGMVLARGRLPAQGLFRLALFAPLIIPSHIAALAWTYVGGDVRESLLLAAAVLGMGLFPIVMTATEIAVRQIEPRLEEAGFLVAPPRRVFRYITLPLMVPAVTASTLIVFVLGLSEFGVPAVLRVRVFTTEVFTAFASFYDFNRAVALAVPLVLLAIVVAGAAGMWAGDGLVTRRGMKGTPPEPSKRWRRAGVAFCLAAVVLTLAVPIFALLREASGSRSVAGVVQGSAAAITNSLLLSAAAATIIVGVGSWLGYARARSTHWGRHLADAMCVALFATPSTIVGIGLIRIWNRPGWLGAAYGTNVMLVLAYDARFLPVAVLLTAAIIANVSIAQEEAAAMAGAGWLRTIGGVLLPQVRRGIWMVWLVMFIFSFGELGASILVVPPGEATLPIRIYTLIANSTSADVAALALVQIVVVLTPLAALLSLRPRSVA